MASPPSFHLPFRTIAKKHRKTLFHLLLAVGALHLLPVSWQSSPNRKTTQQQMGRYQMSTFGVVQSRQLPIGGNAPPAAAAGTNRERAGQKGPLDHVGEKSAGPKTKRRKPDSIEYKNKPVFVWLKKVDDYDNEIAGSLYRESSNKIVTLSTSMDSMAFVDHINFSANSKLLLKNTTILWKQTEASKTAKGIYLPIVKSPGTKNGSFVYVLILFPSSVTELARVKEVKFSRKSGDETEMWLSGLVRGCINFPPAITWKTQFKPIAPSARKTNEEGWADGQDATLRIIYFTTFGYEGKKFHLDDHMTLIKDECDFSKHEPDDLTLTYTVTLEMDENKLKAELEKENRIFLLRGFCCSGSRTMLLESVYHFDDLFFPQAVGRANLGSGNGVIRISLQIKVIDFIEDKKKLRDHVFWTTAIFTIDDTRSAFKKVKNYIPIFTVYELI
eukprot:GHVS01032009.1.p1 GENE.GHVS01032009.1~~GHVS01032009.1.p1  ORF type:complete len:444 (-),score=31.10 GHVS01032009.1:255-1586(-)